MSMVITKQYLPRRTFLRGMGVTLALPLLDAMVPALTALEKTAAKPVPRLGVFYLPNGMVMEAWTPTTTGAAYELTPILQSLAPFREKLLVVSGLEAKEADPLPGEGAGDHSRGPAVFLTCVHARKTESADVQAGISMDQIAAKEIGRETQLPSLEVGLGSGELLGACDPGYSCTYQGTIAWRTPTMPLPMENNPRAVFERLFGATDSTDPRERSARIRKDASILDSVASHVVRLERNLGPGDRHKLTEYLEAVRAVERGVQTREAESARELPLLQKPTGTPDGFEEHITLMFDLLALAFQSDLTRVFTFMLEREVSDRTYPLSGVPEPHHAASHHLGNAEKMATYARLNAYHVKTFTYFLEKLQSTPDGGGSLLDNSVLTVGCGISNGDRHTHDNLPLLLLGGGAGRIKGGRHLQYPTGTPLANLHVTVLNKLGIPVERFGDSTGALSGI